jgi:hypothetical protein
LRTICVQRLSADKFRNQDGNSCVSECGKSAASLALAL